MVLILSFQVLWRKGFLCLQGKIMFHVHWVSLFLFSLKGGYLEGGYHA
jgi:hypothetical protein